MLLHCWFVLHSHLTMGIMLANVTYSQTQNWTDLKICFHEYRCTISRYDSVPWYEYESAGSLRKQEYSRISKVPQRCHRLPLEWPLRRFAAFAISSLSIGRLPSDFTSSLVTSYSTSVPILEVIRAVLLKSRFCSDTFGNHCTKSYLNSHLFCWLVALKL